MNICSIQGKPHYYLKQGNKRSYIREKDKEIIIPLCQKSYDEKVLYAAQKELQNLRQIEAKYKNTILGRRCEDIYENLPEERKKYVEPIELPDDKYIQRWLQADYVRKGFKDDAPNFFTDAGERVRSKAEVLIAHALMKHQVPYRYEYPVFLDGYGWVHPDFTVLNIRTRKEFYFEHLGMMDDVGYSWKTLQKIIAYEKNGIFPGDKLILTHETTKNPLDIRLLDTIIEHYLK